MLERGSIIGLPGPRSKLPVPNIFSLRPNWLENSVRLPFFGMLLFGNSCWNQCEIQWSIVLVEWIFCLSIYSKSYDSSATIFHRTIHNLRIQLLCLDCSGCRISNIMKIAFQARASLLRQLYFDYFWISWFLFFITVFFSSHLLVRKNLISLCYHIAGITCKCTASTWYVQTVVGTVHVICSSWEVQFYSRPIWLVVTIEVIPSTTLGCWDEHSFLQNLHFMNSQSVSIWGLFLCFLASSCSYNPYHWTQRAWCLMGC